MRIMSFTMLVFEGHNPYFNRWFSAIYICEVNLKQMGCHNPYFNRWFSAMN